MGSLPQGLDIPALTPPPGVASNFIDRQSRGSDLIITSAICLTLMSLLVMIRFYTKIYIKHKLGWDDYACLPAVIGTIGFAAVSIATLKEGVGPHQWNVPVSDFTPTLFQEFLAIDILYSPSILMAKLSLLLLYLEIFRPNVKLRYFIYFGMIFITLFYTATMIAYAILCSPRPGQTWLESALSPDTARSIPLSVVQGSVNVISDFYVLILPIPGVWQLQLPVRKKLGVSAIFMTGFLACMSSVFGLYYRTRLNASEDVTWELVPVLFLVVIELTVGIMCGCMPALASFLRYHLPPLSTLKSLFSSKLKSSSSSLSKHSIVKIGSFDPHLNSNGYFLDPAKAFSHEKIWVDMAGATKTERPFLAKRADTLWQDRERALLQRMRSEPEGRLVSKYSTLRDLETGRPPVRF